MDRVGATVNGYWGICHWFVTNGKLPQTLYLLVILLNESN